MLKLMETLFFKLLCMTPESILCKGPSLDPLDLHFFSSSEWLSPYSRWWWGHGSYHPHCGEGRAGNRDQLCLVAHINGWKILFVLIFCFLKHTCSVRLILGFTECVFFACCSKKGISFSPHVTHRRVTLVFQERRQAKVDLEWRCGGRKRLFKETQTQEKKLPKYCELFPF